MRSLEPEGATVTVRGGAETRAVVVHHSPSCAAVSAGDRERGSRVRGALPAAGQGQPADASGRREGGGGRHRSTSVARRGGRGRRPVSRSRQGHGRIETRVCYVSRDLSGITGREQWADLSGVAGLIKQSVGRGSARPTLSAARTRQRRERPTSAQEVQPEPGHDPTGARRADCVTRTSTCTESQGCRPFRSGRAEVAEVRPAVGARRPRCRRRERLAVSGVGQRAAGRRPLPAARYPPAASRCRHPVSATATATALDSWERGDSRTETAGRFAALRREVRVSQT